jgi:hypothetical protein
MPAPVAVARVAPTGIWIPDGFRTKVCFSDAPNLAIFETAVTPAGVDNGEPIEQDSMWNVRWRMKREHQINEFLPTTIKFMYDPAYRSLLNGLCGHNQTITESIYDGSTCAYFGYPRSFIYDEHVEGKKGTGTAVVQPTNVDPASKGEFGPVFVNVAGS